MTVLSDDSWRFHGIPQVRLFKLAADIRWAHRIHEQITPALRRKEFPLREADVVIRHTGYQSPEVTSHKWERNLRLLLLDIAEYPNDPSTLFHLGMTYTLLARYAEAVPFLHRALLPLSAHNPDARLLLCYLA